MNIEFTDKYEYYFDTQVVGFEAFVDGTRIIFKISDEALQDHFTDLGDSVKIFLANRVKIEEIARAKVEAIGLLNMKTILIGTRDIL